MSTMGLLVVVVVAVAVDLMVAVVEVEVLVVAVVGSFGNRFLLLRYSDIRNS